MNPLYVDIDTDNARLLDLVDQWWSIYGAKGQLARSLFCIESQGVPLPRAAIPCSPFYGQFFPLVVCNYNVNLFYSNGRSSHMRFGTDYRPKTSLPDLRQGILMYTLNQPDRNSQPNVLRNVTTTRSIRPNFNAPFAVIAAGITWI